ncbi:hypothetical protein [Pseudomonas phage vB_Pa-PAC2]
MKKGGAIAPPFGAVGQLLAFLCCPGDRCVLFSDLFGALGFALGLTFVGFALGSRRFFFAFLLLGIALGLAFGSFCLGLRFAVDQEALAAVRLAGAEFEDEAQATQLVADGSAVLLEVGLVDPVEHQGSFVEAGVGDGRLDDRDRVAEPAFVGERFRTLLPGDFRFRGVLGRQFLAVERLLDFAGDADRAEHFLLLELYDGAICQFDFGGRRPGALARGGVSSHGLADDHAVDCQCQDVLFVGTLTSDMYGHVVYLCS